MYSAFLPPGLHTGTTTMALANTCFYIHSHIYGHQRVSIVVLLYQLLGSPKNLIAFVHP